MEIACVSEIERRFSPYVIENVLMMVSERRLSLSCFVIKVYAYPWLWKTSNNQSCTQDSTWFLGLLGVM